MCDFFWQPTENDQGDLTDIIRGGGHTTAMASSSELSASDWPLPTDPATFPPPSSSDNFGNPFPNFQDPLLNDFLDHPSEGSGMHSAGNGLLARRLALGNDQETKSSKPCNIMPRIGVVQMPSGGVKPSPLSPRAIRPYPIMPGGGIGPPSVEGVTAMQQISSPRGTGMKRRFVSQFLIKHNLFPLIVISFRAFILGEIQYSLLFFKIRNINCFCFPPKLILKHYFLVNGP